MFVLHHSYITKYHFSQVGTYFAIGNDSYIFFTYSKRQKKKNNNKKKNDIIQKQQKRILNTFFKQDYKFHMPFFLQTN